MIELLLFAIPATLLILGALIVVFAKNPVHNAMGLVLTLTSLAILYITLNATFVAMVQMLVYAGAVMTLFLFVIMMIGVDKPEQTKEQIKGQKLLISGTLILLIATVTFVGLQNGLNWNLLFPQAENSFGGTPSLLASALFTSWVLPFEIISILLIVATTAALALAYEFKKSSDNG